MAGDTLIPMCSIYTAMSDFLHRNLIPSLLYTKFLRWLNDLDFCFFGGDVYRITDSQRKQSNVKPKVKSFPVTFKKGKYFSFCQCVVPLCVQWII